MKILSTLLALTLAQASADDVTKPHPEPPKLETVKPTTLRLDAVPNKDRNPAQHRSHMVWSRNTSGKLLEVAIEVYSFKGDSVTKTMSAPEVKLSPRQSNGYPVEMDVAPENGWVVLARDKAGALIAIKGSTQKYEVLARTPGGLTGKPVPAK